MINIVPSLASANQLNLQAAIDSLGSINRLHLDIEDGNFIPNITFGLRTIAAVSQYSNKRLDAHLMVSDPFRYIDDLTALNVMHIAVHAEAMQYPAECLNKIRSRGGHAGIAFNLQTSVDLACIYENLVDYVLIMTSEPDLKNQEFCEWSLQKITYARQILPPRISIMVDGGITQEYLPQVIAAGADTIIMGRAIWGHNRPWERCRELIESANSSSLANSKSNTIYKSGE